MEPIPHVAHEQWEKRLVLELTHYQRSSVIWLYGIHGIGKTHLLRNVLRSVELRGRLLYIDSRADCHVYGDPVKSVLTRLTGRKPSKDQGENCKRLLEALERSNNCTIILDEIDAFSAASLMPLWRLFLGANAGGLGSSVVFVATRCWDYYRQAANDESSYKVFGYTHITPLPRESVVAMLSMNSVHSAEAERLYVESGGNPTIIVQALRQAHDTKAAPNLADASFLATLSSYYRHLWSSLPPRARAEVLALCLATVANSDPTSGPRRKLDGAWPSFRDSLSRETISLISLSDSTLVNQYYWPGESCPQPMLVAPSFMAWIARRYGPEAGVVFDAANSSFSARNSPERRMFGIPVADWADAGKSISTIGGVAKVAELIIKVLG